MSEDKPNILEQARGYVDMIQDGLKTDYYLGMEQRLKEDGFSCLRLIEPPESESITVETDAPTYRRLEIHNEVLWGMVNKYESDKSIPYTWRKVMIHTLKRSIRPEKELEKARLEALGG